MAAPNAMRDFKYLIQFGNHASNADFDPATPATDWLNLAATMLPEEDLKIAFNQNVNQRRPNRATGLRVRRLADALNDIKGASPTLNLKMPAEKSSLDFILASTFQKVTEAAGTPFKKDFTFPPVMPYTSITYPDFAANGGAFFTIIEDSPVATTDQAMQSLVVSRLTLSCYQDRNDGRLYVNADCIGKYHFMGGAYIGAQTIPTSWSYWNFADIDYVKINGVAVVPYGFNIVIDTGIKPIPYGGSSNRGTTNYAMVFHQVSGSIDLLWDATVRAAIAGEVGSGTGQLAISWGNRDPVTTDGDLLIKLMPIWNRDQFVGDEEVRTTLDFDCAEDTSGGSIPIIEAHMCNALDRGSVWAGGFWG